MLESGLCIRLQYHEMDDTTNAYYKKITAPHSCPLNLLLLKNIGEKLQRKPKKKKFSCRRSVGEIGCLPQGVPHLQIRCLERSDASVLGAMSVEPFLGCVF